MISNYPKVFYTFTPRLQSRLGGTKLRSESKEECEKNYFLQSRQLTREQRLGSVGISAIMMEFFNLTNTDTKKIALRIAPRVFFLWNQSGNFEFSFERPGAEARIFALYIGKGDESFSLSLKQLHQKPRTASHLTVLTLLDGVARFSYDGLIRIKEGATHTDASQRNTNILLSEEAHATSKPTLEILEDDVAAHHASATGTFDRDALFLAESYGISPDTARCLLAEGAVRNFFDEMGTYTIDPTVDTFEHEALKKLTPTEGHTSLAKRKT